MPKKKMTLERLGWFVVRRRRLVLAATAFVVVAAGIMATALNERTKFAAFEDPHTQSYKGNTFLEQHFHTGTPNLFLLITAKSTSVDDPGVTAEANSVESDLADEPYLTDVSSYWSLGHPVSLRNRSGHRALISGRITGDDEAVNDRIKQLRPRYQRQFRDINVQVAGSAEFVRETAEISVRELKSAELVTGPITVIALVVVFGSVVAALLPLGIAILAILGTAAVLFMLTYVTSVNSFALYLTTILGLGLGVDYSLFVVNRFREELGGGYNSDEAAVRAVQTAGRTVLFSATAMTIAMSVLLTFPLQFVKSLGFAGMATAAVAGLGALVVLPAVLAGLGTKVNGATLWHRSVRPQTATGFWHRTAVFVMGRPLLVSAVVLVVLLVSASPVLHLKPGLIDDRELPKSAPVRKAGDILRAEFPAQAGPLFVVLPHAGSATPNADLSAFATRIAALPGVDQVDTATGRYTRTDTTTLPAQQAAGYISGDSTYLQVATRTPLGSGQSEHLIEAIRHLPSVFHPVLVTGEAAIAYDVTRAITDKVPLAFGLLALATFVMLFVQFGSLLIPLKALVLNVLSLSAVFGLLVWVFQDGHLSSLFNVTATGTLYINLPILIFFLAFGLSMDYELFLLSRIKEEYDGSGDNRTAVAVGLARSGRIVSAAAILIAAVFLSAGLSASTMFTKAFGFGLGFVVLLDAFLIRGTLVPALMLLAGSANWWSPRPLRRVYERFGVSEHVDLEPAAPMTATMTPGWSDRTPRASQVVIDHDDDLTGSEGSTV